MSIKKGYLPVVRDTVNFHVSKVQTLDVERQKLEQRYLEDQKRSETWASESLRSSESVRALCKPMSRDEFLQRSQELMENRTGHLEKAAASLAAWKELENAIKTGPLGKDMQAENAKARRKKNAVLKREKNAPRVDVLVEFKRKNPGATLPEAARELVSRGLMGKCDNPERAAKKWVRDHEKELPAFSPGRSGHPLGVPNSRKP